MAQTLTRVTALTEPTLANALAANEAALANLNPAQLKALTVYWIAATAANRGATDYRSDLPGLIAFAEGAFRDSINPPIQSGVLRMAALAWNIAHTNGVTTETDVATWLGTVQELDKYPLGTLDKAFFAAFYLLSTTG